MMKVYENTSQAYLDLLQDIYDNPEFKCSPRGQLVYEKLDQTFRILNPTTDPIETMCPKRNKAIRSYTQKETDLYNKATNDVEDFAEASSFWRNIQNSDGTVNSAYGYLIWSNKSHGNPKYEQQMVSSPLGGKVTETKPIYRTPWDWAKKSLIKDPESRQAIIRFNLPEHAWFGNKDFPCTMHGIFTIRDNRDENPDEKSKLNLTINMRSNDLVLGLVYDMPWFVSLMYKMKEELYNETNGKLDLDIGYYTHMVHSLHIYRRDFDKVQRMLGREQT